MIAMNADHIAQARFDTRFKLGFVSWIRWVGARRPGTLEAGRAPETILRPEQHAQFIARPREGRGMRIMRPADEIEAGFLHQLYVAEKSAFGHRIAPTGMVLMNICALEIKMLPV